jgi:hypothetical protein
MIPPDSGPAPPAWARSRPGRHDAKGAISESFLHPPGHAILPTPSAGNDAHGSPAGDRNCRPHRSDRVSGKGLLASCQ